MKLCFFALFAALTFALPPKSLQKQNQELSRTNEVLVQALKELTTSNQGQAEKAVADWGDWYGEVSKDCYSFPKNCQGCRGYLDSCCSDKNCASGRKCKAGIWSYSCDSAAEQEEDVGSMGKYKCVKRNDCISECQADDESKTWYACMKECPKKLCEKDAESESMDPEDEEDDDSEEEAVGLTCYKDGFAGRETGDVWCDKRDGAWMHKCSGCRHGYYWYWWHTYCCTPGKSGCTCAYN